MVAVHQVQIDPGEERVVLGKPAVERLSQLGDLVAQPPLGQISQCDRVAVADDQRLQHRAPRYAEVSEVRAESLIPASSSGFSSRWAFRARSLVIAVRARGRSRSRRDRLGRPTILLVLSRGLHPDPSRNPDAFLGASIPLLISHRQQGTSARRPIQLGLAAAPIGRPGAEQLGCG